MFSEFSKTDYFPYVGNDFGSAHARLLNTFRSNLPQIIVIFFNFEYPLTNGRCNPNNVFRQLFFQVAKTAACFCPEVFGLAFDGCNRPFGACGQRGFAVG